MNYGKYTIRLWINSSYFADMQLRFQNWTDYHHQIYRIYHGIIALSLVPFFLLFLELEVASIAEPRVSGFWRVVLLVILIPICGYWSWMVWKSPRFSYREVPDLKDKLIEFRRVEVMKYFVLEGVCVLGLLGLWLTSHYLFILVYFAVLVQFSFLRPSEDRLIRSLKLSRKERDRLHEESI